MLDKNYTESVIKSPQVRRRFLRQLLSLGYVLPFVSKIHGINDAVSKPRMDPNHKNKGLRILILGGTSFLGPHQIVAAMSRGHRISIFTRGRTVPTVHQHILKHVEILIGDREDNLNALKNREWDVVIDNSGQRLHWTEQSAELLKDHVQLYCYTSSTGVYYPYLGSDIKENTELVTEVPENINDYQQLEYGYGVMKALSEQAVVKSFGKDRSILVRPTYMMGPGDRTDRFIYWPVRIERGGTVMVPGFKSDPVQYIDVRDVANYMIHLIENKITGVSNAVGPASATSMQAFVHGVHAAFSAPIEYEFINNYKFLREQASIEYIVPWIMPIEENAGSALINNKKGIQNGLTFTPLAHSIQDIYSWWHSEAITDDRRDRLVNGTKSIMNREKDILRQWEIFNK